MILDTAMTQIIAAVQRASAPTKIAKKEAPSMTARFSRELANVLCARKTNDEWLNVGSIFPGMAPGCDALVYAATRLCTMTVKMIVSIPQKAAE